MNTFTYGSCVLSCQDRDSGDKSDMGVPLFLVTKRRVFQNLLDQGTIEQTLQLCSSFCEFGSFGVDGNIKEHNEPTVALDKVHDITAVEQISYASRYTRSRKQRSFCATSEVH